MAGDFMPGQRMAVEELAAKFGVSTMPVREALIALANEGLLEVLPQRGFRVAVISRQDVEDLFHVHALIAGLLADRAASSIDRGTIEDLHRNQTEISRLVKRKITIAERGMQIEQLNFQFHRAINDVPDSQRLRWFLRAATRFIPREYYIAIPEWIDATAHDHPAIIRALEERKASQARKLMEAHVLNAGRLVIRHLESRGLWRLQHAASI
jgi:DNA-binding GntR family transcriptional regulator